MGRALVAVNHGRVIQSNHLQVDEYSRAPKTFSSINVNCVLRVKRKKERKKSLFNKCCDLINVVNHSRTFYKFTFALIPLVKLLMFNQFPFSSEKDGWINVANAG